MSYKGGDRAEFGIIDDFDTNKDYGHSYEPERYHCVAICDDALDDWWERLTEMNSYFHCFSRPSKALARWGITIIPPECNRSSVLENFWPIIFHRTIVLV